MWVFKHWPNSGLFQGAVSILLLVFGACLERAGAAPGLWALVMGLATGMIVEGSVRTRMPQLMTGDMSDWSGALPLNRATALRQGIASALFLGMVLAPEPAKTISLIGLSLWVLAVVAIVVKDLKRHAARNAEGPSQPLAQDQQPTSSR
jgi:hypothetical protein